MYVLLFKGIKVYLSLVEVSMLEYVSKVGISNQHLVTTVY